MPKGIGLDKPRQATRDDFSSLVFFIGGVYGVSSAVAGGKTEVQKVLDNIAKEKEIGYNSVKMLPEVAQTTIQHLENFATANGIEKLLGQYRTILSAALRSQIFCQTSQKHSEYCMYSRAFWCGMTENMRARRHLRRCRELCGVALVSYEKIYKVSMHRIDLSENLIKAIPKSYADEGLTLIERVGKHSLLEVPEIGSMDAYEARLWYNEYIACIHYNI